MFPPAGLSDLLLQPPPLGGPGSALGNQVMLGLTLSAAAPPTLARTGPAVLVVGVGSDRGVAEQELVVSACEGLLSATQFMSHLLTS